MPKQQDNEVSITELGFFDFKSGWVYDIPTSALPVSALSDIQNFKFVGGEKEGMPTCLKPRYGTTKVAISALPDAQVCHAGYYFNGNYIGASATKLYYWNTGTSAWVEIGTLNGKVTDFTVFNNNLIICDGGITKTCNTSWVFNKLHNRYQNELVGTGDGVTTNFNLDHFPIVANSQTITVGGVTKTEGTDYTINDTTGAIVFTVAPGAGLDIIATYLHSEAGPKSKRCFVRKNRLWLTVDADNPSNIWYSGVSDHYAWNSAGIGGVPDGGYESVGLQDGYSIKDFCLYFNRMYVAKDKTLYVASFDTNGKITSVDVSIPNIAVNACRCLDSADNNMFMVTKGGTFLLSSELASITDFIRKTSLSKSKNDTLHLENYNANSYSEYFPVENQLWVLMSGLNYILVVDMDGRWTKYKFNFSFAGFNYSPNGEMLICGSDGYLRKYDTSVCTDDGAQIDTFFYTSYQDFGSSLIMKEGNKWSVQMDNTATVTGDLSFYVDKAATACLTISYTSPINADYAIFDGIFFRRVKVYLKLTSYSNTNVILSGIKCLVRLIPE